MKTVKVFYVFFTFTCLTFFTFTCIFKSTGPKVQSVSFLFTDRLLKTGVHSELFFFYIFFFARNV